MLRFQKAHRLSGVILTLVLLFSATGESHQTGDLIFLSMPCYSCELIEKTTHSPFSHVGILDHENGKWTVYMAASPKVMKVDLDFLLSHANKPAVFKRFLKIKRQALAERAAHEASTFLGVPYDDGFTPGTDRLYCSEFIYYLFKRVYGDRKSPFYLKPMTFSPFEEEWARYFNGPIPEGQLGISPGDISNSPLLYSVLK